MWFSPERRVFIRTIGLVAAILGLTALPAPPPAGATLSVRPAYIEMNIDRGRPSDTITVSNIGDQETRYRIQVVHFVYSETGNLTVVPPDRHSLAPWVKFNPREFTLAPGASQAIRLTIIPPRTPDPGEYWAAVWFEPLTGRTGSGEDGAGRKMTIKVETNILVPIVGLVPKVTYDCSLDSLKAVRTEGGIQIAASLANIGLGRVAIKGDYEILDASSAQVAKGEIGDDTILAGGRRVFNQTVPGDFPDGEYTVRVQYVSKRLPAVLAGETRVQRQ